MWQYFQVTGDLAFLRYHGAEIIVEIARLFSSLATYEPARERYDILGVLGPDEYHDAYPGREEPGLDNNAYTNVMTAWLMCRAADTIDALPEHLRKELKDELRVTEDELGRWEDLSRRIFVPFHDGVISQFEGYEDLEELDWQSYRTGTGTSGARSDPGGGGGHPQPVPALQAGGRVDAVLPPVPGGAHGAVRPSRLSVRPGGETSRVTWSITWHARRTARRCPAWCTPGSWLVSTVLAPGIAYRQPRERCRRYPGRDDARGIHLGAMAGTVDIVQRAYTGLVVRDDCLWFDPALPEELVRLDTELHYRGHRVQIELSPEVLRLTRPGRAAPIRVGFRNVVGAAPGHRHGMAALTRRALDRQPPSGFAGEPAVTCARFPASRRC